MVDAAAPCEECSEHAAEPPRDAARGSELGMSRSTGKMWCKQLGEAASGCAVMWQQEGARPGARNTRHTALGDAQRVAAQAIAGNKRAYRHYSAMRDVVGGTTANDDDDEGLEEEPDRSGGGGRRTGSAGSDESSEVATSRSPRCCNVP